MKAKREYLVTVWLFVWVLLAGMTAMQGCETSEPSSSGAFGEAKREMDEQRRKATIVHEPEKEFGQTPEQMTCPIMGMAIDKNVYTEYQGKKVYFCCAGCETPFLENPEKYVSKLPQFNK
ncbi:MAG: YHS domain-containing protein [Planctomycetota bacterium]